MEGRVLLIGATQGTGFLIAQALVERGESVRAMARNPPAAAAKLSPKVEIVAGDLTQPASLAPALRDVSAVIFTAGVTQRPAPESLIKAVEYEGVRATLAAAQQVGFRGRFLYMTSLGVNRSSFMGWLLNKLKGNTLVWRREAEAAIRQSGLPYTIIRAGVLTDAAAGSHSLSITQGDQPLGFATRVARADVAQLFVQALDEPRTARVTLEVVWAGRENASSWLEIVPRLRPDAA